MARLKKSFSDYDQLCKAWVEETCHPEAHTRKKMQTQGDTIWSFGDHFCLCRRFVASDTGTKWYLVTNRYWSPTTSNQRYSLMKAIRSASKRDFLVELQQVDNLPFFPSGTEADLGQALLRSETDKLKYYTARYTRMIHPYGDPSYYFNESNPLLHKFNLHHLPETWELLLKCQAHQEHRRQRNLVIKAGKRLAGVS